MKRQIKKHYALNIDEVEPIGDGQTSQVLKIITDKDNYILKSQLNIHVAVNEFNCLDALSKMGLSPEPVCTVEGETFIDLNGSTYILMKYIESDVIDKSKLDFHSIGKTISVMHHHLNTVNLLPTEDRFDEIQMIEEVENMTLKSAFYKKFKEYDYNATEPCSIIHGDLGSWNLIKNDKNILVIDFGEVRLGNPYFDLAAVTESLKLNQSEGKQLLIGYGHHDENSFSYFSNMRRKWVLRGILFSSVNKLKNEDEILALLESL